MANDVWSNVFNWPVIGVHAILTPDGKVLTYGTDQNGQQGALHIFDVWDPVTNTHKTLEHHVHTDIFCSASIISPQTGEILVTGGDTRPFATLNHGVADVNIYDYRTETLSESATGDMTYARWYPTLVTLANGKTAVFGGSDGNGIGVATPELYTPGVGWSTLDGAKTDALKTGWFYPASWLLSDGRIAALSSAGNVTMLDPSGTGKVLATYKTPFLKSNEMPSIMFDVDKAMTIANDGSVWIMDFSTGVPKFTRTQDANGGHFWSNLTLMADGNVLLTGGSQAANQLVGVNYTAAIWNPDTGKWTYGDDAAIPRLYHSTTLLLQDGSVLSLGGGAPGPLSNLNGEIYKPAYLTNADGTAADRPVITSAPTELEQRQDFKISVDDPASISRLILTKYGATTHAFNMEARQLHLKFTVGADGKLNVDLPDNANVVTPGYWMLFAVDKNGVPSVASTIHIATGGELYHNVLNGYLTLNGAAQFNAANQVFDLTPDQANSSGAVFSNKALNLQNSFSITAEFKFGWKEAGTGGISFVLQDDPLGADATGSSGNVGGAYGIHNGLAIEIDVSNDGWKAGDIAQDHTGFSDIDAAAGSISLKAPGGLGNIEDNRWHKFTINWVAGTQTLRYAVDGKVMGTLTEDLAAKFLGGSNLAHFGFTGGTGAIGNTQQVRLLNVVGTFVDNTRTAVASGHDAADPDADCTFELDHLDECATFSGGARYDSLSKIATLTSKEQWKVGAMMSDVRLNVQQNFTIDFDAFFGTADNNGDGLAFVLHNDPLGARTIGTGADGIGLNGIRNGLAIEFDTWNNGAAVGDIPNDHTRFIDTDARMGAGRQITGAVDLGNIEDGYWHNVKVTWNATTKTLSYSVDGKTVGTLQKDLTTYLGGSNWADFGFTASNGGAVAQHQVRINDVSGTLETGVKCHTDHEVPAMTLSGDAGYNRVDGWVRLTSEATWKAGAEMSGVKVDLTQDFDIKFDLNFGARDNGGEGMAFVLHNDARGASAIGGTGASLGAVGIAKGLGIEFDTYNNGNQFQDIAADHSNFFDTDAALGSRKIGNTTNLGNIEDGLWHAIHVQWNATTHVLSYEYDGRAAGVINVDLSADYLGGSELAYFGVTGSTGGATANHYVRFVSVDGVFV